MKKKSLLPLILIAMLCLLAFSACTPEAEPPHTHSYASEWTQNETHHWHEAKCEHNVKSAYAEHEWTDSVLQEPTCTEAGIQKSTCATCGYTVWRQLDPVGHDLTHVSGKDATCTEKGLSGYNACSRCDYREEQTELPALGHDLVQHETKTPTQTENGWEAYETCSRCDYSTYVEIPALEHDLVFYEGQAPTCYYGGHNGYYRCRDCNYTTWKELPALGHDYVDGICTRCGDIERLIPEILDIKFPTASDVRADALFFENHAEWVKYCTEHGVDAEVQNALDAAFFEERVLVVVRLTHFYGGDRYNTTYELTDGSYVIRMVSIPLPPGMVSTQAMWNSSTPVAIPRTQLEGRSLLEVYKNNDLIAEFSLENLHVTHTYDEGAVIREATCSTPGLIRYTCTVCGHIKEESIPKTDHTFGEWHDIAADGCAGSPYSLRICLVCRYVQYDLNGEGVIHPHDFEESYVAPTCTESGRITLTCTRCGIVGADEPLAALGHSLLWESTADGHRAVCQREGCDYEGAFTPHVGGNTSPCLDTVCTVCGYLMQKGLGHDLSGEWTTNDVGHWHACTRTGCTVIVDYALHRNGEAKCTDSYAICTVCRVAYRPNGSHHYGEWNQVKAPTCTEQGEWECACTYCGKTLTRYTDALGHRFGAWETTLAPTETAKGKERRTCAVCGHVEERSIPATGHNYGFWYTVTDPTCTESGQLRRDCKECDEYQLLTVAALGHRVTFWYTDAAPTCTESGAQHGYCARCGVEVTRTPAALGHTWGSYQRTSTTHYRECVRCDAKTAPALHSGGRATCTGKPVCAVCGTSYGNALGHSWATEYSANAASHYHACLNGCGGKRDVEAHHLTTRSESMEHKDDGAQKLYIHRVYQYCDTCAYENVISESLSIHYGIEILYPVEPTCTTPGKTLGWKCAVRGCTGCDTVTRAQETIPALGHNYVNGICTRCGHSTSTECKHTNTVILGGYPATCTQDGLTNGRQCATCHTILTVQQTIPALGHAYATAWSYNATEHYHPCTRTACTAKADTAAHIYDGELDESCNICGATRAVSCSHPSTVPVPGHPATCTAPGLTDGSKCGACQTVLVEQETIPVLGHDEQPHAGKSPTCTEIGWDAYVTCKREDCDYSTYVELPAAHAYATAWSYNDTEHYHPCTRTDCAAKADTAAHTPNANGLCTACGHQGDIPETDPSQFNFNKVTGGYEISKYNGSAAVVKIPAMYNGKPVVGICTWSFLGCTSLTSITIPDSVTSIDSAAFRGCTSLANVTFGENSQLTSIGKEAFYYCESLTSITIPDSVASIGNYAFSDCTSLTSIKIPDSVTSIGDAAFSGCTSLTSIEIPSSVTSIGFSVFKGCTNIEKATLPTIAILQMPKNNLKTVVIISGISIDEEAFYDCRSLESVTIPDSVKTIDSKAFYGCTGLMSINIPDSVTCIEADSFYACTSVIQIENGVSYVDKWVVGCDASVIRVALRPNTVGIVSWAFSECKKLEAVEIPEGVTNIGNGAFADCESLISIEIPEGVTNISSSTFDGCKSLISIKIPATVVSIDYRAFGGCEKLSSVTFEANSQLTSIGNEVFSYCTSLKSITIPAKVNSIETHAFYTAGVTSVIFENPNGWYVTRDYGATSGIQLNLTDAVKNVTYLKSTYYYYLWYRR
ncbi:MAG: leucine-rich repeat domain-containing protein [Clostridia bacterium]|nr:leucine-rich repeat domain-containing protein [Clostridia bacterium]